MLCVLQAVPRDFPKDLLQLEGGDGPSLLGGDSDNEDGVLCVFCALLFCVVCCCFCDE